METYPPISPPSKSPTTSSPDSNPPSAEFSQFSLPSILELIRVLISLTDPKNKSQGDFIHRIVALNLILVGLEISNGSLSTWISYGKSVEKMQTHRMVMTAGGSSDGGVKIVMDKKSNVVSVGFDEEPRVVDVGNAAVVDEKEKLLGDGSSFGGGEELNRSNESISKEKTDLIEDRMEQDFENDDERMAVLVKDLITNELSRFLFQIFNSTPISVSSPPSPSIISLFTLTFRVASTLLSTNQRHFKLHLEWLLVWIMSKCDQGVVCWDVEEWTNSRSEIVLSLAQTATIQKGKPGLVPGTSSPITSSPGISGAGYGSAASGKPQPTFSQVRNAIATITVGEVRELILETLGQFARNPSFFVELYFNYDGDMLCTTHLFEELIRFVCKHSFPDATPGGPATYPIHQSICVDILLLYLKHVADRNNASKELKSGKMNSNDDKSNKFTAQQVLYNKTRKRILMEGADKFNEKSKEGIKFWQEHEFLPTPITSISLAKLLKTTTRISKQALGDFLSKPDNVEVLNEFMELFLFDGKRIDEALRMLLESFRLPGESQQIERIMLKFAKVYFKTFENDPNKNIADEDSTFLLAYSVIMLNTDQHNPQVRKKMTFEDFTKNTRGLNSGQNFAPEYLREIFVTIRDNEIIMPAEHEGDLGFSYNWKELIKKDQVAEPFETFEGNGEFDLDMFMIVWNPILASLSYAYDNAEDDQSLEKAILGFQRLAMIAAHYHLNDIFDQIVSSLSKICGLGTSDGPLPPERSIEEADTENKNERKKLKTDRWAVDFGRNYKSQTAAVLLFSLGREYGDVIRQSWKPILECLKNLFLHSLLPLPMLEIDSYVTEKTIVPRIPPPKKVEPEQQRKETGLFSTLTQFLSLSGPFLDEVDEFEPTAEELDSERRTIECVQGCKLEELFSDSRFMETDALLSLISCIKESSFETPIPSTHKQLQEQESNVAITSITPTTDQQQFNASGIFFLELLTNITIQNRDRINLIFPAIVSHLGKSISPTNYPKLIERGIVNIIKIVSRVMHKQEIVAELYKLLTSVATYPSDVFSKIAEEYVSGLIVLVDADSEIFLRFFEKSFILDLVGKKCLGLEGVKGVEFFGVVVEKGFFGDENFTEIVDLFIGFNANAGGIVLGGSNGFLDESSEANGRTSMSGSRVGSPKIRRERVKSRAVQMAIERSLKSIEYLYKLHATIPALIKQTGTKPSRAFIDFWLPVLSGLSQQCYHPAREVRQHALTYLQRALLSPELESPAYEDCWFDCFETVLFPLLDELLKPEMVKFDPQGMDETRMRASALLCKIFLQYLNRFLGWIDLPRLWGRILEYHVKYMRASGSEYLFEGVLESVKNMLLVMSTQGVFHPPEKNAMFSNAASSTLANNLWELAWVELSPIVPNLKNELFADSEWNGSVKNGIQEELKQVEKNVDLVSV
ncbi:GDP/GTP exchange factor for ARF [Nowakowskiella sp. JEL0407]|nr:GDP/GTP exchange factor for ARF [Nowakowskiella sp. JEL0407]